MTYFDIRESGVTFDHLDQRIETLERSRGPARFQDEPISEKNQVLKKRHVVEKNETDFENGDLTKDIKVYTSVRIRTWSSH